MVQLYEGDPQAVIDTFAKHATVVSSSESFLPFALRLLIFVGHPTSNRHGVNTSNLFVAFKSVQDAEKVLSSLDGKVTVNDRQYDLVYGRERGDAPRPKAKGRSYGRRNE